MSLGMSKCDSVIVDASIENEIGNEIRVSIGIQQGRIVAIDPEGAISGHHMIDAQGESVTAGLIDPHVHFNEPGREDWEGFDHGSRACLAGGITCFFDMPLNSSPVVTTREAFHAKRERGEKTSWTDFGLWAGLIPGNTRELAPLQAAGVIGIKAFMCDSGLPAFPACDTQTLRAGMSVLADLRLRLALHAEHPNRLGAPGLTATEFLLSRPPEAEYEAVRVAIGLATETECPIHIVHVSCPATIEIIARAQKEGIDVTCETCPHYLLLHDQKLDALGTVAKCAPPLRPLAMQGGLVAHLQAGRIDFLASDHSPCPAKLKRPLDFASAWGGISSVQHGFPLMQAARILPQQELVERMSLHPARVFNLPSKGRLAVGCDADLVIWDMDAVSKIHESQLLYRNPHTPYSGFRIRSQPRTVFLRGQCVYDDGNVKGAPAGRFVRPEPDARTL